MFDGLKISRKAMPAIAALDSDPKYAAEREIHEGLRIEHRRIDEEIRTLRGGAFYQGIGKPDHQQEDLIAAAQALLGGATLDTRSTEQRIRELEARLAVIRQGAGQQNEKLVRMRELASAKVMLQLRDHHRKLLREIYGAAIELVRAAETERALRAEIVNAGYQCDRHDLMPSPALPPHLLLPETAYGTVMQQFKEQLEKLGILDD